MNAIEGGQIKLDVIAFRQETVGEFPSDTSDAKATHPMWRRLGDWLSAQRS